MKNYARIIGSIQELDDAAENNQHFACIILEHDHNINWNGHMEYRGSIEFEVRKSVMLQYNQSQNAKVLIRNS